MTADDGLQGLRGAGWRVGALPGRMPPAVAARYRTAPADWRRFAEAADAVIAPTEDLWFLTWADFGATDVAFTWDAFERLSLESCAGEPKLEADVRRFWDAHLPVLLSVRGHYAYLAIDLADGRVVHGEEPEFEQTTGVASSFRELVERCATRPVEQWAALDVASLRSLGPRARP